MVKSAPTFADIAPKLMAFLGHRDNRGGASTSAAIGKKKAKTTAGGTKSRSSSLSDVEQSNTIEPDQTVILVAHSAGSLDAPMLTRQLMEAGYDLTDGNTTNLVFADTIPLLKQELHRSGFRSPAAARRSRPDSSLKLSDLKARFSIASTTSDAQAHRAEEDALVMWEVIAHATKTPQHGGARRSLALLRAMGRSVAQQGARSCFQCHFSLKHALTTAHATAPTVTGALAALFPDEAEAASIAESLQQRRWDSSALDDLVSAGSPVASLLQKKLLLERSAFSFLTLDPRTGQQIYLHPDRCIRQECKMTSSTTGRTASAYPNCQNIPKFDKSEIRKMFVSRFGPENGVCVEVDYKQLEVNVQALLCQDPQMKADLAAGVDFHIKRCTLVANESYDALLQRYKAGDKTVASQRQTAKIMSFQRMYGAGKKLMQKTAGVSGEVIDKMVQQEEQDYPGIHAFNQLVRGLCFRDGNPGVPTHYVAEMPNGCRVSFKPRDAINNMPPLKNYPIQAYAAELVQAALGRLFRALQAKNFYNGKALMVNFVHDSVWFDAHIDVAEELLADASAAMSCVAALLKDNFPGIPGGVEFNVSASIGRDMFDMDSPERFFAALRKQQEESEAADQEQVASHSTNQKTKRQ
jgi:DNA polymerase-1